MTETATPSATVTLRTLPADWTPPADWERHDIAPSVDAPGEEHALTGYRAAVAYVLDVAQRELSVHPADGHAHNGAPGEFVAYRHIVGGVVPSLIHLGGLKLATTAELARPAVINALLEELQPLAQEIVDNLLPVAGTTGLDWTARAYHACRKAEHIIGRRPYRGTEDDFPYRLGFYTADADAVLRAFPSLIAPGWAACTDQELQDAAGGLESRLYQLCLNNSEALETAIEISVPGTRLPADRPGRPVTEVRLHGARAWLHAYRRDQAAGLTPMDAARWDGAAHHALHIADDTTDDDLTHVITSAKRDAAAQGVKLLGTTRWAHNLRTDRRNAVRAQLDTVRDEINALEAQIKPARQRRAVLVTRVLGWGEGDTDSGLGRAAGLSHTAVANLRAALDADDISNA
ncbi:hypothetical protein ACF1FX_34490 [Streptomyces sp. NPDC014646]|uniref:hypothetical protein n=1 Tax=Streptomyces sp. NPDC014646 TaxID=3364877 RepID=UPI0036F5AAB6